MLPIAFGALAALGILLAAYAIASRPNRVQTRLAQLGSPEVRNLEELELDRPFLERTVRPIAARLSGAARRMTTASFEEHTAKRLAIAGNPAGLTPTDWVGVKVLAAIVFGLGIGGLFLATGAEPTLGVLFGVAGAGLGYLLPEIWLGRMGLARQNRIVEMIPDALDLLTISVRAGLGFDAGLDRVIAKMDGPLSDEFRTALAEVRVGKPRRDALRDIVARTEVRPLTNFISAVIQAERLGVPIAKVLQVQSEQLRVERRQRAEEAASKAPIQMLFPLVGCVFPALFVVILGPALIILLRST